MRPVLRPLIFAALLMPAASFAQDDATLADIRQEIAVLTVELQRLQREVSTTGPVALNLAGTSALDRIDSMESELRRLTSKTEEMENRILSIVTDGTNRLGDLTFRVCEIEPGCDIGALGETSPLGGASTAPQPRPAQPVTSGAELAVGEQADFDRAKEAFDSGSFRNAADLFAAFAETYTTGPLTQEALFLRGQSLAQLGEQADAARAYLAAFSGAPDGAKAPDALLELGRALSALGQTADACATLGEVPLRFPGAPAAAEADSLRASLGCA
ncbi:tol-pal system protein YbgF [Palleronia caenipelagi]|uniref:Cell division coordinator CpoB n=1 Tax=Palleronia caenipelagi TaxID=2489174 RepID=A0A547Q5K1_9RHOB|nr:tol-pal system protein YbgF [Palleronia caenipelagi]TRD21666.1 tol-pal system protein YbgF [Palleronia caenipelagi]